MAESMQGMHRTHRCTELSNANIGEIRHRHGMGAEEQKSGRYDFRRSARSYRHSAD